MRNLTTVAVAGGRRGRWARLAGSGGRLRAALLSLIGGQGSQRGGALVNQLIALAIIGVTLAVFVSALSTTTRGTLVVKQQVTAQSLARRQLELIKQTPECLSSYSPITDTSGYTVHISEPYSVGVGLQLITITVRSERGGNHVLTELEGYKRGTPIP